MKPIPRTPKYLEQLRLRQVEAKRKWREANPVEMQRCRDNWRLNNHDRILLNRREKTQRLTGRKVVPRGSVSEAERREKARQRSHRWYHENKHLIVDKVRARSRRYYSKHGSRSLLPCQLKYKAEWQRVWRKANRDKIRAYHHKSYQRPQRAIRMRLCSRITNVLKRNKIRKSCKSIELIGCTWAFLKSHIENQFVEGMSWANRSQWHIDHIKPCAKFDLTDPVQQKICFNYTNLQPLWWRDNITKGAKWQEAA